MGSKMRLCRRSIVFCQVHFIPVRRRRKCLGLCSSFQLWPLAIQGEMLNLTQRPNLNRSCTETEEALQDKRLQKSWGIRRIQEAQNSFKRKGGHEPKSWYPQSRAGGTMYRDQLPGADLTPFSPMHHSLIFATYRKSQYCLLSTIPPLLISWYMT